MRHGLVQMRSGVLRSGSAMAGFVLCAGVMAGVRHTTLFPGVVKG